jgi:hypothetical protein
MGQQTFTGNTLGGASTLDTNHPLCAAGASGPSRTYAVTAGAAGFLTAWLNRPADHLQQRALRAHGV